MPPVVIALMGSPAIPVVSQAARPSIPMDRYSLGLYVAQRTGPTAGIHDATPNCTVTPPPTAVVDRFRFSSPPTPPTSTGGRDGSSSSTGSTNLTAGRFSICTTRSGGGSGSGNSGGGSGSFHSNIAIASPPAGQYVSAFASPA